MAWRCSPEDGPVSKNVIHGPLGDCSESPRHLKGQLSEHEWGTRTRAVAGTIGRSSEGHGSRWRGQYHDVNLLIPATYGYPIRAAPWVLRLNERVKRRCKHNLAWRRVRL
jgi:hypothetical protein